MAQLNLFFLLCMQLSKNMSLFGKTEMSFLMNGGQDWTRTSDPRLIKAVL